ncbi:MAG: hypothetical protein OXM54_17855, partial [Acidimicrobiaceae bacterium]|nr:hypothetical protein [Acidimicrobiaceae bacterium]
MAATAIDRAAHRVLLHAAEHGRRCRCQRAQTQAAPELRSGGGVDESVGSPHDGVVVVAEVIHH